MTHLIRLPWRLHSKMYRRQLALSKPSVYGTCYYPPIENIKGVNIPPKYPFGGTEIHRTQRTKVCQVLQVPVLMNKWKSLVTSIVIVLCKWHSHGACKQFLVSRKHCPWELVYRANCFSNFLFMACTEEHLPRVWENHDKSLISACSLHGGLWDPKSIWRLKRNVLSFFFWLLPCSWSKLDGSGDIEWSSYEYGSRRGELGQVKWEVKYNTEKTSSPKAEFTGTLVHSGAMEKLELLRIPA